MRHDVGRDLGMEQKIALNLRECAGSRSPGPMECRPTSLLLAKLTNGGMRLEDQKPKVAGTSLVAMD